MLQPTSSNSSELRGSAGISIPLSHYFHQQDLHSSDSTNVHTGAPALPQHVGLRGLAATCSAPAGPAATSKVDQPTAGRFSGGPSALHAMKLLLWSWIHCTIDEKVLRPQLWYQSQLQSAVSSGSASTNSTGSSKRRKPTEFDATVKQLRKRLSSDVHAVVPVMDTTAALRNAGPLLRSLHLLAGRQAGTAEHAVCKSGASDGAAGTGLGAGAGVDGACAVSDEHVCSMTTTQWDAVLYSVHQATSAGALSASESEADSDAKLESEADSESEELTSDSSGGTSNTAAAEQHTTRTRSSTRSKKPRQATPTTHSAARPATYAKRRRGAGGTHNDRRRGDSGRRNGSRRGGSGRRNGSRCGGGGRRNGTWRSRGKRPRRALRPLGTVTSRSAMIDSDEFEQPSGTDHRGAGTGAGAGAGAGAFSFAVPAASRAQTHAATAGSDDDDYDQAVDMAPWTTINAHRDEELATALATSSNTSEAVVAGSNDDDDDDDDDDDEASGSSDVSDVQLVAHWDSDTITRDMLDMYECACLHKRTSITVSHCLPCCRKYHYYAVAADGWCQYACFALFAYGRADKQCKGKVHDACLHELVRRHKSPTGTIMLLAHSGYNHKHAQRKHKQLLLPHIDTVAHISDWDPTTGPDEVIARFENVKLADRNTWGNHCTLQALAMAYDVEVINYVECKEAGTYLVCHAPSCLHSKLTRPQVSAVLKQNPPQNGIIRYGVCCVRLARSSSHTWCIACGQHRLLLEGMHYTLLVPKYTAAEASMEAVMQADNALSKVSKVLFTLRQTVATQRKNGVGTVVETEEAVKVADAEVHELQRAYAATCRARAAHTVEDARPFVVPQLVQDWVYDNGEPAEPARPDLDRVRVLKECAHCPCRLVHIASSIHYRDACDAGPLECGRPRQSARVLLLK